MQARARADRSLIPSEFFESLEVNPLGLISRSILSSPQLLLPAKYPPYYSCNNCGARHPSEKRKEVTITTKLLR